MTPERRIRAREAGIMIGGLPPGPLNAITDVKGVGVGHVTLVEGAGIRTGVTAIVPHGGDLFADRVPAAIVVGNGYGKLVGLSQVQELGEIEAPIALTNTLSVPEVMAGVRDWMLDRPGAEKIRSLNVVVGETNDGVLNDIRARAIQPRHAMSAIKTALDAGGAGQVAEGAVGAGAGVIAFGWKGGIGVSSRRVTTREEEFTVGVLVQANFGGDLTIAGAPVWRWLTPPPTGQADGSVMVVVATDAPLSDSSLRRVAQRALLGIGRTGSSMAHGSGDYVIAFSTAEPVRRMPFSRKSIMTAPTLPGSSLSLIFQGAVEATEEAVINAIFAAVDMKGHRGEARAIPIADVLDILHRRHPHPHSPD